MPCSLDYISSGLRFVSNSSFVYSLFACFVRLGFGLGSGFPGSWSPGLVSGSLPLSLSRLIRNDFAAAQELHVLITRTGTLNKFDLKLQV